MPVYVEYALKVSVGLAMVFLFYTFLLKRMTYYKWNRYFLLMFSALSFIVPFINISEFLPAEKNTPASFINEIPSIHSLELTAVAGSSSIVSYWQILATVFLLGSFVLVVRLCMQLLSIRKMKSKSTLLADGEERIYHIQEPILPFSFLNNIFINTNNYSDTELAEILDHERVHVRQNHSFDMLFSEVLCILNWYNPFAWMIKNAITENLEFIADEAVISKGVNKKNYQYLLLKVTGELPASIASSLKFSSLKNRVMMMNKSKTSRLQLLKFGLLVPILTLLLLAFRNTKEIEPKTSEIKTAASETYTLSTLAYSIPDPRIKSIIINEKDKSLLRPGDLLNLTLILNEKKRLTSVLQSNGYNNLKQNAIRFMIDTTSSNNSFSVEIKINLEPGVAFIRRRNSRFFHTVKIIGNSIEPAFSLLQPGANVRTRSITKPSVFNDNLTQNISASFI
jgi:beta-lactamase regulating signal transducer with metallopeptidase domain